MAAPIGASTLVAALRREGLRVEEVGDWRTHNRNHKGAWGPVHGVMIHHTVTSGSAATVRICRTGYSSLPGPLCHGVITKDGRVHLVGHGRANHAGLGDDDVLRAVIAETDLPADNETNTDGNRHFYGFECENLGDGRDPWPAAQLDAIERAAAALCRHHGWKAESVIGHLEWQPGKVDPRGFSMDGMRARIRERLDHAPGWDRGGESEEDGMAISEEQLRRIIREEVGGSEVRDQVAQAVWWWWMRALAGADMTNSRHVWPATYQQLVDVLRQQTAQQAARDALLERLAEGGGLTAEEARAAAVIGARTALVEIGQVLVDGGEDGEG